MERNIGLDILKISACFSVIILHVTGIIANTDTKYTINHTLYYIAVFAVPIFFMVNGCLLLNKNNIDYKYVIKKIINILLVVLSWNMLIFLAELIIKRKIINPFYMLFNNFIEKDYFWQFWFLGALILIYLVLPMIHKCFGKTKSAIIITGIFVLISLIIDFLSLIRSFNEQSILQIHVIQTFRVWTWLAYYLLGGLLGKIEVREYIISKISKKINIMMLIISLIVISLYQYNIGHYFYNTLYSEYFYDNIFTYVYIISLFFVIYRQNFKIKHTKPINLVSNNIMGIYIVHVTIIKGFTHFYKFNTSIPNIVFIFIVFICSFILTFIISQIPLVNRLIKV